MPKQWKPWTSLEISQLRKFRAEGLTYREIADRMNRSWKSIRFKCQQLQLFKLKKITKQIKALQVPHLLSELAENFGVTIKSMATIKWMIKKMGFTVAQAIDPRTDDAYARKAS